MLQLIASVVIVLIVFVIGPIWLEWYFSRINHDRNTDALNLNALKDLNTSKNGLIYVGSESEIILKDSIVWTRLDKKCGYVKYMCKTNKGNWFNLEIPIKLGVIGERRVFPLSEQEAKDILYINPSLYRQHFGEPEKA